MLTTITVLRIGVVRWQRPNERPSKLRRDYVRKKIGSSDTLYILSRASDVVRNVSLVYSLSRRRRCRAKCDIGVRSTHTRPPTFRIANDDGINYNNAASVSRRLIIRVASPNWAQGNGAAAISALPTERFPVDDDVFDRVGVFGNGGVVCVPRREKITGAVIIFEPFWTRRCLNVDENAYIVRKRMTDGTDTRRYSSSTVPDNSETFVPKLAKV